MVEIGTGEPQGLEGIDSVVNDGTAKTGEVYCLVARRRGSIGLHLKEVINTSAEIFDTDEI